MAGKNNLSLAIVVKLLTDNFNKGANKVKSTLLTMQRNFYAFAAAAGAGTLGLSNFLSKMIQVSKETSRASIALKNVSGSTASFADNQKWLLDLAKRYGVEINSLTTGFAKFKAAADISSMSLDDQRKIFESVARASVAFGLSAEDQRGVFMALSQMMSKNKVMAEELRLQLAERMPVAIQAMAKAVGVSVNELDAMMKQGKVMSADVLPKFADALNELIANPDLDNLNKSLVDLSNTFQQLVEKLGIGDLFKHAVETATKALAKLGENTTAIMTVVKGAIYATFGKGLSTVFKGFADDYDKAVSAAVKKTKGGEAAIKRLEKAQSAYNLAVAEQSAALEAKKVMSVEASAQEREAIEARVANANKRVKEAEAKVFKAEESKKIAASKASAEQQILAAQSTATGWERASNILTYSFASIGESLLSMIKTNVLAAALTLVTTYITKLASYVTHVIALRKEVEGTYERINSISANQEITQLKLLQTQIQIGKEENLRRHALQEINKLLGTEYELASLTRGEYLEINEALKDRIAQLIKQERINNAIKERAQAEETIERLGEKSNTIKTHRFLWWGWTTGGLSKKETRELRAAEDVAKKVDDWFEKTLGSVPSTTKVAKPTKPTSEGPLKVEVVNINPNEITDNGKYTRENLAQALNESLNKYADKLVAQKEFQDIINQQRDTSGDWKLTPTEILEADALFAQDKFNEMLRYAGEKGTLLGTELGEQLGEAMANATTLKEAVRFAEMLDALKEAQAGLRSITLNGIEGAVSDIDSVVNAFDRLNQAIDEDATAWEKIMATFELFSSTIQAVIGIMETVTQAQEAAAKVKAMTAQTTIAANAGETASEVGAKVGAQSGGWAALVAVPAAISAILAAFAMIPKFANGGIVSGGPKQGDKILARLNAGEAVLTPTGLASLHDAADPKNVRNIHITGHLVGRGRDLQAVLDTENKYRNRIG